MTKVQQLNRRNLVFGVLAALLLLLVVLRPPVQSAIGKKQMPLLAPKLELELARAITIARAGADGPETMRLVRTDESAWTVESRDGYPADPVRVRGFLENLQKAREKRIVTEQTETFADYARPDGWIHVRVDGAIGDDKVLAELDLGKGAKWPDSFVKMKKGDKEVVIRAYDLWTSGDQLEITEWISPSVWPGLSLELVSKIDVYQRDEKVTLSFGRKPDEAQPQEGESAEEPAPAQPETVWVMRAPKSSEVERLKVEGLVRTFTGMRAEDVVGRVEDDATLAEYGFDKPAYRVVVHLESQEEGQAVPAKQTLLVGKPRVTEDSESPLGWYVKKKSQPWVFEVSPSAIADIRQAPDAYLPPPPEEEAAPAEEPTVGDGGPDGDAPNPTDGEGSPDGGALPGHPGHDPSDPEPPPADAPMDEPEAE